MKSNKLVDFFIKNYYFYFYKNLCIISLILISYDNIISRLSVYHGKINKYFRKKRKKN